MTRIKRFDASIEQRHYLALKRRVKCGITRLAKYFNMNDQRQRKYYNLLRGTQVETLLLGRVGVLRNLARKFDRYLPPGEFWNAKSPAYNKDFAALSHRVRKAFRYEGFRDGKDEKGMWCGWALAREYSKVVKYCPYCNSETLYAFEWIDDKGNRRLSKSAFDHYFPRARYPYLGLSLYNLIPSCTRCNSSLKGDFGDSLVSTAHPFGDDLDSLMKFHILPKCRAAFYESSAAGIAHIVLAERQSGQSDKGVRWERLFRISDSYDVLFKDDAAQALARAMVFSESYKEEIKKRLEKACLPSKNLDKILYGTSLRAREINFFRHGKMIRDIIQTYRGGSRRDISDL